MTAPNMSQRIVSALQLEPMTIRQIARALSTSEDRLRVSMRRLEDSGRIRRAGFAPKTSRMGTTPYLWRAA